MEIKQLRRYRRKWVVSWNFGLHFERRVGFCQTKKEHIEQIKSISILWTIVSVILSDHISFLLYVYLSNSDWALGFVTDYIVQYLFFNPSQCMSACVIC